MFGNKLGRGGFRAAGPKGRPVPWPRVTATWAAAGLCRAGTSEHLKAHGARAETSFEFQLPGILASLQVCEQGFK